jgi:hypothetical protein
LIEPVLQHPTLQTLRLLGTNWTGFEVNRGLRWPQATSNIQVLDLKECVIDADGLEDVFRRCPKLRELRIDLGDWRRVRDSDLDDDWELDLEKFGEIIRRCGGNLETFGLNTVEYKSYYDTDGKLGSFRALHDLKKLLIIPKDWVGIDSSTADGQPLPAKPMKENLPESLEWLHLYYNDDAFGPTTDNLARIDVDTQLYNLITSERVPNLRKVTVERIFGLSNDFEYKDFVRGWESNVTKMHNWGTCVSSRCMRTLMTLTKVS